MSTKTTLSKIPFPVPEGSSQYPLEYIESQRVIKLGEEPDKVIVGITEKTTGETKNNLVNFHQKPVEFIEIDAMEFTSYLSGKLGEADAAEDLNSDTVFNDRVLLDKLANDAPIINLVNSICLDGIHSGASDIHIEAGGNLVRVRYRIDGMLRTVRTVEPGRFPAISSRIKIMANLNILERRHPQDGRITVSVGDEHVDLRVSVVPVTGGESIVLRILGKKMAVSSLASLGFGREQLAILNRLLMTPHGLILMTGPTGSGKTTTLNAMLGTIVSESIKVITIEDPVEFLVDGVNQIQINEQIGLGFDVLLRRVLRQDPNVIMIGEIRDSSTAGIALRSALTGHLVLSTMHTNDTASVIHRLINMGIEPYLIASVLRGAAAQRLVRRICPHCKCPAEISPDEKRLLDMTGIKAENLYKGAGCPQCGYTGFLGRTLIAEVFAAESGLEELILRHESPAAAGAYLRQRGMKTLLHEGMMKAAEGLTTIGEIEREIMISEEDFR
jgi:general secretion pathway protein E/type IV pilus assembly protein PilB